MRDKLLNILSILIISFYTFILLFSIDGLQRSSTVNNLLNKLPSFFTPAYSFTLLFILIIILTIIVFSVFKKTYNRNKKNNYTFIFYFINYLFYHHINSKFKHLLI